MTKSVCARAVGFGISALVLATPASALEPDYCLSENPGDWPAPSKPYFMLAVDTSGSMIQDAAPNSCGHPANRNGAARCAILNAVQAFSGVVNFGLMAFPRQIAMDSGAGVPHYTSNVFQRGGNHQLG